jgi:hypothetical protein
MSWVKSFNSGNELPELNDVGNRNALVHPLRLCLLSDPLHSAAATASNAGSHSTPIGHHHTAAAANHRAAIADTQVSLVVLVVGPTIIGSAIVLAAIFVRVSPKAKLGATDVSGTTAVAVARPTVAIAGTALAVPGVSRLATRLSLIPHPKNASRLTNTKADVGPKN